MTPSSETPPAVTGYAGDRSEPAEPILPSKESPMPDQPIATLAAEMGAAAEAAAKGPRWEKAEHASGAVVLTIDGDADDQGRCIVTTEVIARMEDSTAGDEIADYLILVQPTNVFALVAELQRLSTRLAESEARAENDAQHIVTVEAEMTQAIAEAVRLATELGELKAAMSENARAFVIELNRAMEAEAKLAESEAREKTAVSRCKALNEALTPSADTKAAYIGEIKFSALLGTDEHGDDYYEDITVPWDATKTIMAMILGHAAMIESAAITLKGGS